MDFPDLFKLEKLTIEAFADSKRSQSKGTFEAMFNPETFDQTFQNNFRTERGTTTDTQAADYAGSLPATLSLTLFFDDTGVEEMGVVSLFGKLKSVKNRIKEFLDLTYAFQGSKHEPYYLMVRWGELLKYPCRLSRVKITYIAFDRDSSPLRAKLEIDLLADEDTERQLNASPRESPDVTHSRVVTAGDTLPLLTRDIYGTSAHYLAVARSNKLDHFRSIDPGQEILFPPIAK